MGNIDARAESKDFCCWSFQANLPAWPMLPLNICYLELCIYPLEEQ